MFSIVLASDSVFSFDIPELVTEKSLNIFAQQAEQQVLYPFSKVKGIKRNILKGIYSAQETIAILLKDTGLIPLLSSDGVFTVETDCHTSVMRREMKNKNSQLMGVFAMLFAAPLFVQGQSSGPSDSSGTDAEQALEVVVVKGIRRNITDAIISKRGSDVIVDGISADDIGSFPDINVAEAMQQLPGVSITRNNLTGEGENVSVRGFSPGQTMSLMDGEQLLIGSFGENITRAFNYGLLPTFIVSKIDVYKSSEASLLEGGIGGTVNVKTRRPLDIKKKTTFAATVKNKQNDLVDEVDPSVSFLAGWNNEAHDFGFLVSAGYQRTRTRADSLGNRGWDLKEEFKVGSETFENTFVPFNTGAFSIEADREKKAALTSIEYQPSDNLEFKLDHFFTQESGSFAVGRNTTRQHTLKKGNNVASANVLQGLVPNHNVATDIHWVGGKKVFDISQLEYPDYTAKSHNTTLVGSFILDEWEFTGKLGYATSEGGTGLIRTATYLGDGDFVTSGTNAVSDTVRYYDSGTTNRFDLLDPNNYNFFNYSEAQHSNENTRKFARLNISKEINGNFFRGFETGAYYQNTTRERWQSNLVVPNPVRNSLRKTLTLNGLSKDLPDNYLSGHSVQNTPTQYITADPIATRQALDNAMAASGQEYGSKVIPGATYAIDEDYFSAFGKLDFAHSFDNVEMRGNVGVRVAKQEYTVRNFSTDASADELAARQYNIKGEGDATEVLPSLNLVFELPSDVVIRFATSKVISRPKFKDLARQLTFGDISKPDFEFTAKAGNPDLDPLEAIKYDLSAEWYYAEGSLLSIAYFHYDIESFILDTESQVDLFNDGNIWTVTRPENGDGGEINGFEVGFTHQFTHLPSPFDGFGLQTAYTSLKSTTTAKDSITGGALPLAGLSENTFTTALTYSKNKWNASLRYNKRDDYFSRIARDVPIYFEDTESLTAQIRYKFNKSLGMFIQGTNLTDWGPETYAVRSSLKGQSRSIGRNYIIGANYRF